MCGVVPQSCQEGGARPRWIPPAYGAFTGLGPDLRHASFGRRATSQGVSVLPNTPWPTLRGLDARHPFAGGSRPGGDFALPWTPSPKERACPLEPCLPRVDNAVPFRSEQAHGRSDGPQRGESPRQNKPRSYFKRVSGAAHQRWVHYATGYRMMDVGATMQVKPRAPCPVGQPPRLHPAS